MTTIAKPIIFLAFANDRDDQARYLRNLADEARQVSATLNPAEQRGHCEVVLKQNTTIDDLLGVFQDARYRNRVAIFHFGGHANGYQLLLETAAGTPAAADAGGLAAFLAQQRGLQLVFLNGCSTERQVQGLLDAGVSAVIATEQAIDDAVATAFSAQFYQGLAGGAAIGAAFAEAAAAMQIPSGSKFRDLGSAAEESTDRGRLPWRLQPRPGAEEVLEWSLPQAAADPLFGLPPLPLLDLPPEPFRHLQWFDQEHAGVFFGRGQQIRDLYQRLADPRGAPILLLYGQSGVGKSSVLAAGLLPRLEQDYAVIYTRRDQALGLAGTLQNALYALSQGQTQEWNLGLAGWKSWETQAGKPLIAVLDQVEEHFTRPNPHLPDEMPTFLAALRAVFGDPAQRPKGKLVLSFRKEWLAEIDKRLAEQRLPFGKVFLERLDRQGVMEAVAGPARAQRLREHFGLAVAPELPGPIADDLLADPGSPVAPTLQILLTKMWRLAKERDYDRPVFDQPLYQEMKRQGLLMEDFLAQQLETLRTAQPAAVDSGLALDLLAFHTTPLGTAEERTVAELRSQYAHRLDALDGLLQQCQELYLLVDPAQNRPGKPPASRLAHDTLAPLVRRRFEESDAPGQRARRILESRGVEWRESREGAPLDDVDLALVEDGLSGMRHLESDEMRMLTASRAASERRRQEREQLVHEREEARQRELKQAQELAKEQQLRTEEQRLRAEQQEEAAARLRKSLREVEQAQRKAQARELSSFAITEMARRTDPSGNLALLLAREAVRTTYAESEQVDKMVGGSLISAIEAASPGATSGWTRYGGLGLNHASSSPDGRRIVGSRQGGAMIVDASDGTKLVEFTGHEGWVNSAVFSPDGRFIVTAGEDGSTRLWDATAGQAVSVLIGPTAKVYSATFHPDGTKLLTAGADGIARMWDASQGKELLQIQGAASAIFSHDGSKIVTCIETPFRSDYVAPTQSCGIAVWDITNGQKLNELCSYNLHGRIAWLNSTALTPDGSYLATAHTGDHCARIWDVSTGREVHHLQGHRKGVNTALFSSDGKQIVTASSDGTVRVWDTQSGQVLLVLENFVSGSSLGFVKSASFSPDNRYVIVSDEIPRVVLYLVSIPYMLNMADSLIQRAFTKEERQDYLHEPRDFVR